MHLCHPTPRRIYFSPTVCYIFEQLLVLMNHYLYPRHTKYVEGYIVSSFRPSIHPSVFPSVRPSIHPSVRLSVRPSIKVLTFYVKILCAILCSFLYFWKLTLEVVYVWLVLLLCDYRIVDNTLLLLIQGQGHRLRNKCNVYVKVFDEVFLVYISDSFNFLLLM